MFIFLILDILRLVYERWEPNDSYSKVLKTDYGLEKNVWPVVYRCLHSLVAIRQKVRFILISDKSLNDDCKQRLYEACDVFRDLGLVRAGIRLQDRVSTSDMKEGVDIPPFIGLIDSNIILKELKAKDNVGCVFF